MTERSIQIARIYLTESEHLLDKLVKRLHDQEHVRGVTVYRGIMGFGPSGKILQAGLIDLATDLPLVVEFFDDPAKIATTLEHIREIIDPGHIVTWPASLADAE